MPALFVNLTMDFGAEFLANGAEETLLDVHRPMVGGDGCQGVVKLVVVIGNFDVFDAKGQKRHVAAVVPDGGQKSGLRRTLEGDTVSLLAVAFLEIRREDNPDRRKERGDGRRDGRDGVIEILPEVLFGQRKGREVRELTAQRNQIAAKAPREF